MIMSKHDEDYKEVGFIKKKVNGDYKDVQKIYRRDEDGNYRVIFERGYGTEYDGANNFRVPAVGKDLKDYTIFGNSEQNGFPTPDSPIEPEFVGDLVSIELDEPLRAVGDYKDALDLETKTYTKRITDEIVLTGDEDWISAGTSKTFYFMRSPYRKSNTACIGTLDSVITYNGGYLGYGSWVVQLKFHNGDSSYTTDDLKAYLKEKYLSGNPIKVWYCVADSAVETQTLSTVPDGMTGVIEGTVTQSGTPTPDNPIEPVFIGTLLPNGKYQVYRTYKIPISSAGQTKNIYLGQVQSTRKIKKLVLTGEEDIRFTPASSSEFRNVFYFYGRLLEPYTGITAIGTHFENFDGYYAAIPYRMPNNNFGLRGYGAISWYFSVASNDFNSLEEFVTYIKEQYDNGTPFTIWYVLATPETGIVNEPLCKIGDYADSVDFSQAGVEIPTLKKPNTTVIDVETSLEPSEVDVTYRATYRPSYQLFLAANGDSFEAKDGQSLYIGKDEKTTIYGWHVDPSISDPSNAVTYLMDAIGKTPASMSSTTFNYGSWKDAFFMPKPCMVKYDGTVDYYLDPDDYTRKADGSPSDVGNPNYEGNAMMEWPLIWYKFEGGTEDGEGYFYVANNQVDSTYHCWCNYDSKDNIIPHFYTAIYNSTSFSNYNASTTYAVGDTAVYDGKLWKCTTAITEAEAFDSTHWEVWSETAPAINKYHSMSGLNLTKNNGASNTNGATEITRSTANNTTSDVEWYTEVFSDRLLISALLVLMGKSINTQDVFGRGLDSGDETAKNNYVTGSLNDKGLFWGVTNAGTSGVKVFGMENYWACLWRRTAGCVGVSGNYKIKLTYGTADGTTAEGYNSNGNGYLDSGVISAIGYVKTFRYSENGFVPDITTGGSNFTYYADYFYKGNGYLLVGGRSGVGARCGAFYFDLNNGFSLSIWSVSAALSCKPVWKG